MSNSYFQFKQFTVHQERCAMKVCTDACLFGAWVAAKVQHEKQGIKHVLDIGTGTGLLSLMLAQQTDAAIDAVEIEEMAAQQAADNFETSPWDNRLQVIQGDIRRIHLGKKYDLIISNPPFFENNLKSPDTRINLALHSEMLELEELMGIAKNTIADGGRLAILLPYDRKDACIHTAKTNGFSIEEAIAVKQSGKHGFFRSMLLFARGTAIMQHSEITIRDQDAYHPDFISLLQPYYLNL